MSELSYWITLDCTGVLNVAVYIDFAYSVYVASLVTVS